MQQQQSNVVKPQKVNGSKLGMTTQKNKNRRPKLKANTKPLRGKGKKPSNTPSFNKVEKSVKKTMGY